MAGAVAIKSKDWGPGEKPAHKPSMGEQELAAKLAEIRAKLPPKPPEPVFPPAQILPPEFTGADLRKLVTITLPTREGRGRGEQTWEVEGWLANLALMAREVIAPAPAVLCTGMDGRPVWSGYARRVSIQSGFTRFVGDDGRDGPRVADDGKGEIGALVHIRPDVVVLVSKHRTGPDPTGYWWPLGLCLFEIEA